MAIFIFFIVHGFELDDGKNPVSHSRPALKKERFTLVGKPKCQSNQDQNRRSQYQDNQGNYPVGQGFEKIAVQSRIVYKGQT